jgi:hypothetical protein
VEESASTPPVGFFCHIMKTGGTSIRWMLLDGVLEDEDLAPYNPEATLHVDDVLFHHINPFLIREAIANDHRPVKVIAAHYPFLAHKLYPYPLATFTLFRDPVDRVVSHVMHLQRDDYPSRSYEEIYGDQDLFDRFLYNLQARAFVFEDTEAKSMMERTFDWDDDLLERAKANVETCDIIGLNSEFGAFVRRLEERFGWKFKKTLRSHRSPRRQAKVSKELRARIHEDLAYDRRFYEHVLEVYAAREPAGSAAR